MKYLLQYVFHICEASIGINSGVVKKEINGFLQSPQLSAYNVDV